MVSAPAARNRNLVKCRSFPGNGRLDSEATSVVIFGLASPFASRISADQVVVFDVLNLVGEDHKTAIDLVQLATLELVAELFTALSQRMVDRNVCRERGLNRARQPTAE